MPVCEDHLRSPPQAHHEPGGDPGRTPLPHLPTDVSPHTWTSSSASAALTCRLSTPTSTHSLIPCSNPSLKGAPLLSLAEPR